MPGNEPDLSASANVRQRRPGRSRPGCRRAGRPLAHLRRASRPASNRWRGPLDAEGVGPGSRVAAVVRHHPRGRAAVRRPGQDRAPSSSRSTALLGAGRGQPASSASCRPDLVHHRLGSARRAIGTEVPRPWTSSTQAAASATPGAVGADAASAGADPHVAFFTSGSTGRPKGAVLSHAHQLAAHPSRAPCSSPGAPWSAPIPLFHMGAWTIALQQWQARDAVVFLESADGRGDLRGGGPAPGDPAQLHSRRLAPHPRRWPRRREPRPLASHPVRRHRHLGHAPRAPRRHRTGCCPQAHLRVFYGSTEAGSVACLDHADIGRKPGSCGPPAPGVAGPPGRGRGAVGAEARSSSTATSTTRRPPPPLDGRLVPHR